MQEKDITRRTFLKIAGVAAAATGGPREILAILEDGSIIVQDHHVPAEKGLSEAWKKSLFERGVKEVWSGAELESIGMPCGGIASGQLYLCGDGTLGNWEIFNTHEFLSYGLTNYAKREVKKQVRHGFTLIVGDVARSLDKKGFKDVTFNGQYPVATVGYADESAPVSVSMRAYSPFIPLNAKDSSLPATVFEFEVKNTTEGEVRFRLTYEMENPVGALPKRRPARGCGLRKRCRATGWRGSCTAQTLRPKSSARTWRLRARACWSRTSRGTTTAVGWRPAIRSARRPRAGRSSTRTA